MRKYEFIVYGKTCYRLCNQTAEQVKEDIKRIRPLVKSREVLGWSLYKQGFIGPRQRHSVRLCKVDPFGRNFKGPGIEERIRAFI